MENKSNNIINKEIKKRLNSSNWNMDIASGVFSKRSQKKKKIIYSSSVGSLAAASLIIISSFLNLSPNNDSYETFISNQVMGTYYSIFENKNSNITKSSDDFLLANGVDNLIDDTLSVR